MIFEGNKEGNGRSKLRTKRLRLDRRLLQLVRGAGRFPARANQSLAAIGLSPLWGTFVRLLFAARLLPMFRAKEMALQEWSRFLEAIDQAALAGDDEIPALLVRDFAGAEESLVLLAGELAKRATRSSSGASEGGIRAR